MRRLALNNEGNYKLLAAVGPRSEYSQRYSMNLVDDQPPDMELSGVEPGTTILVDSVLPVTVGARDDFGLRAVALSRRRSAKGTAGTGRTLSCGS